MSCVTLLFQSPAYVKRGDTTDLGHLYAIRKQQDTTLSQILRGRHEHRLHDATDARRQQAQPYHTQSEAMVTTLLDQTDAPRDPHALQTRLDDLFVALGLRPTLEAGLLPDALSLTVGGDGTTLASAASGDGRKLCDCPPHSDCDHPRSYTNATAQFCKDAHHDGYTFGDRSYRELSDLNSPAFRGC